MTRSEATHKMSQLVLQEGSTAIEAGHEALEWAGRFLIFSSGDDANRAGFARTPERFAKAYKYLTSGYRQTVADVIGQGIFEAEGGGLVTVLNVEYFSLCEHHLLPFWGHVSVAYYPDQKILGLSKVARLVELFARRLQVQERFTRQLAEAIDEVVSPRSVAVKAKGQHLCMMMRGVEKQNSQTATEFSIGTHRLNSEEQSRLWVSFN